MIILLVQKRRKPQQFEVTRMEDGTSKYCLDKQGLASYFTYIIQIKHLNIILNISFKIFEKQNGFA